jgi:hypothetical protein
MLGILQEVICVAVDQQVGWPHSVGEWDVMKGLVILKALCDMSHWPVTGCPSFFSQKTMPIKRVRPAILRGYFLLTSITSGDYRWRWTLGPDSGASACQTVH